MSFQRIFKKATQAQQRRENVTVRPILMVHQKRKNAKTQKRYCWSLIG